MEKFQIPQVARPYTDALRKLIPTGVTATPGLDSSPLIDLKAVADSVGAGADTHDKALAFTELLADLTKDGSRGVLMGKDREVAARLFGLHEWAGVPSRKRYEEVAKLYDKHWTWENFRKEPLDRHLYAVYLALYRQAKPAPMQSIKSVETSAAFDYKLTDYDITYRMPSKQGEPREILEVREIEALVDGVAYWRASTRYWGKAADVGPDITLFGPGGLEIRAEAPIVGGGKPGRAYMTQVTYPKPLKKGERIRFTLLKRQAVEFSDLVGEGKQDCHSVTPSVPIDRAGIRVCFPAEQTPSAMWQFAELEDWMVPGTDTEATRLAADVGNTIAFMWSGLRIGASYGVAWRW